MTMYCSTQLHYASV